MGNKAIYERFAWFDSKVRSGKYPNATMLAGKFEISGKTAQRDIEFMRDRLSCPLVYDINKKGYYYENDSFFLPVTYLSGDELTMLLLARKLLQGINGEYIKNELSAIIEKITGILEKHMRISNLEMTDRKFTFKKDFNLKTFPQSLFGL